MLAVAAALSLVASGCGGDGSDGDPVVEVVAEGLLNPIGLAMLPDGALLVAEEGTGEDDASAGVSLVAAGRVDRVVSGLPSGRDSGDLSGVPLVGVDPAGDLAFTAHFGSAGILTFPVPGAKAAAGGAPLGPADLGLALTPLNRVRLVNPFDIAFAPDGTPVVTDASENGVATANPDGSVTFVHRFGELPAPGSESLTIDAVPTGIARVGDEYYVTLTGGCPYPEGAGRLVAIDGNRGERILADGLDMPIDVAVGPDGEVWVLEFARFDPEASCFTGAGYRAGTGRLSRLTGSRVEVVVDGLDFPGAVLAAPDGSLYVSEVFAGRVLRISFGAGPDATAAEAAAPWRFRDVAADVGLDFRHGAFRSGVSDDPVAAMGGGLCWLDYDGDGRLDLYLVNSHSLDEAGYWEGRGGLPANTLYRNLGDGFEDVTAATGTGLAQRGNGCVAFDYDLDGDPDLYVTADGPNALLRNDGDRFTEVGEAAGVAAGEWSGTAAAGDVDGDGLPDLFVGSYIDLARTIDKPSGAFPQDYLGVADHLYLNRGDGTFADVTAAAGLERADRTLGALWSDVDFDGDLDLYVANDGQPNRLYENRPGGDLGFHLADVTAAAGVGDSGSGMGIAGGDYDGDGALDLFVTNWEAELNALYRNELAETGTATFRYSTFRIGFAGLGAGDTGWGTAWADFDHDTDQDLLVVNGRVPVTDLATDPELVRLFGNLLAEGEPGQLRDWTERTGLADVGPRLGRGSAVADFDDDGDLDVAINQIAGPVTLLRNDSPPGNWLVVAPVPAVPGTRVVATLADGTRLVRELHAGSSYLASEDPRLHFGLADAARADVEVRWPDGATVRVAAAAAGEILAVPHP